MDRSSKLTIEDLKWMVHDYDLMDEAW